MAVNDFDEKFEKLIKIITTDESKAKEFASIQTVEGSYDFACKLVGPMDLETYRKAVRNYVQNINFGDESKKNI